MVDPAVVRRGMECHLSEEECTTPEVAAAEGKGAPRDAARAVVTIDMNEKEARPVNAEDGTEAAAANEEDPSVIEVAVAVEVVTKIEKLSLIAIRFAEILSVVVASEEVTVQDAAVFPTTAIIRISTIIVSTDFETAARRAAVAAQVSEFTKKLLPEVLVGRAKVPTRKTA
jgi:hypothetical protein